MAIGNIVLTKGDVYGDQTARDAVITPGAASSKIFAVAICKGDDTFTFTRNPGVDDDAPDGTVASEAGFVSLGTMNAAWWDGIGASAQTIRAANASGGEDIKLFLWAFDGAATGAPEASDRNQTSNGSSPGATCASTLTVTADAFMCGVCFTTNADLTSVDVLTEQAETASSGQAPAFRCGHTPTPGDTTAGSKTVTWTWDASYGEKDSWVFSFAEAGAAGLSVPVAMHHYTKNLG